MSGFILAIDQGTTGTTAALIDAQTLEFMGKTNKEFPQIFPKPSWVEHNLNDIWACTEAVIKSVLEKFNVHSSDIKCIGITNQRETVGAWNKNGKPLANAIVWQDRRTSDFCQKLKDKGHTETIKTKTGLTVDPYFSGSKINWLLRNSPDVQTAVKDNDLCFGNIDTFLLYKLSSGNSFATEPSNASRTMLFNIVDGSWDKDLLDLFEISQDFLPEVKDSFGNFGQTQGLSFLPDGIPITGILGDQQSALFGQAGTKKGEMKCTYGTGAFYLLNIGDHVSYSENGLLTTVAYQKDGKRVYAFEGSCYIAGAAVQWLRDQLKLFDASPEIEALAVDANDEETENIVFLPFFSGIGSPHWKPEAKACILGLTRDSSIKHISKACLEGVALSVNDLIQAAIKDSGASIHSLKVDGGMVANNAFLKMQAGFSNLEVIRPKVIETTAYGAALAAAIGAGLKNFEDLDHLWKKDVSFNPLTNTSYIERKKVLWSDSISKLFL